jgi:UDP-glucose 4-epimerase
LPLTHALHRRQQVRPAPRVQLDGAKILVTGGAGFVGSNFIRQLREKFKCQIKVVDNLWRGNLDNLKGLIDVRRVGWLLLLLRLS